MLNGHPTTTIDFGHGEGRGRGGPHPGHVPVGRRPGAGLQSTQRLIFPERLGGLGIGIGVIGASLLAAAGLVVMQTWVVRKTGSTAIAADRAHYVTDIAVNAAVLTALAVTRLTGWQRADPAFALVISGYMLWSARGIAKKALVQLLAAGPRDPE